MRDNQLSFTQRLGRDIRGKKSLLVCGIDPVYKSLPAFARRSNELSSIENYFRRVIDALRECVVGVKLQSAFFEFYRGKGVDCMFRLAAHAKNAGLITICDAKRGDISSTALAYAKAYLDSDEFDAMTVNPYLGADSITAFADEAFKQRKGIFVLARTTNPGSKHIQDLRVSGRAVYMKVTAMCKAISSRYPSGDMYSLIGLVAPATYAESMREIRSAYRNCYILVPGIGAQGGAMDVVASAVNKDGLGAIVNISRSLTYLRAANYKELKTRLISSADYYNSEINMILCGC